MTTKILVTGGAGYIGSILVPMLLEQEYEVTVLDSFMYGQNILLDCCAHPRFSVIRGDGQDKDTLQRSFKGADYIFPLAAIVGATACNMDKTAAASINVRGHRALALAALQKAAHYLPPVRTAATGLMRRTSAVVRTRGALNEKK